jgi:hypothetical protein
MSDEKPKTQMAKRPDIDHHLKEWTSGTRGGGKVPADFEWRSNPKQWQEENGNNRPVGEVKKKLETK